MDELLLLDSQDPLKEFKDKFLIPYVNERPQIYFSGNSLGLQPRALSDQLQNELDRWHQYGAKAYSESDRPWLNLSESLQAPIANLVGAKPDEVVVMNSLGVNLHLMMASFYQPSKSKFKVIIEEDAFPTDRYILNAHMQWHGYDPKETFIIFKKNQATHQYRLDDLAELIEAHKDTIALALLPGVQYLTGQVFPIAQMSQLLKNNNITIGWDMAHAIGNIPLNCHQDHIDFAVWCHYKYLNAGPGAVGGCFIHEQHAQNREMFRLPGWWGNLPETRFEMKAEFEPYGNALGWQVSNIPVFSTIPLIASLNIFEQAGGVVAVRQKSTVMTEWLYQHLIERFSEEVAILTPEPSSERGCQISFSVRGADNRLICQKLNKNHIVCDFREPNIIRMAPVPLYNQFKELGYFIDNLQSIIDQVKSYGR
tara:strand:- start:63181 stop:64452 length:1272 start_codon:yes stop_codon:yes gene_type:complete